MKKVNIIIEDFGRKTFVSGTVIFENDKLYNLQDVTIIRPGNFAQRKPNWSIPKCYIKEIEIKEGE